MKRGYSPEERRVLASAVARGEPLVCPSCATRLARHEVGLRPGVAYVRRRVLLICPGCDRSVAVDLGRERPRA